MDTIKLKINGKPYNVSGHEHTASTSLNDFIRNTADLRGTKFMCQEGGCGACVVNVQAVDVARGEMTTFSVNSCLVSIFSCDKWEVTTIEHISNRRDGYHIVSKRLNHFFGSQCGYCSPGFVMSMYSLLQRDKNLTAEEIENSFGSNMCRCTGYRPILEAFKSLAVNKDPKLLNKVKDIEDLKVCEKSGQPCRGICGKADATDTSWFVVNTECLDAATPKKLKLADGRLWYAADSVGSVLNTLDQIGYDSYMLVAGNTSKGARPLKFLPHVLIDISNISELRSHYLDVNLVLGANMTLTETMNLFHDLAKEKQDFSYLQILCNHLDKVAHIPVRNIGTLAGNLVLKHEHPDFQSDIFMLLDCVGATLTIVDRKNQIEISLTEFMKLSMVGRIITQIKLPPLNKDYKLVTYKVAAREQNAHAQINSAFLYKINADSLKVDKARLVFGGIQPHFSHAYETEHIITGRCLFDNQTLQATLQCLQNEIKPDFYPEEPSPFYRKKTAVSLFYKSILKICPHEKLNQIYISGATVSDRPPLSHSYQEYDTDQKDFPLTQPLLKREGLIQCSGEAMYTNDAPSMCDEVFAAFVLAQVSVGDLESIDATEALKMDGVIAVYTSADIPGTNSIVKIDGLFATENEEVLASDKVKYFNQPIAIVVAHTQKIADEATYLVHAQYKNVKKNIVLTIEDALAAPAEENRVNTYPSITPTRRGGNVKKVITGVFESPNQYHYMMELHTSIATPKDDLLHVSVSTQYKDMTQRAVSMLLNMNESQIVVETLRCGGGFGCKISRNNFAACATALVAKLLNKQCRMVMHLRDVTRATGKRPNTILKYEVGVDEDGQIQYLDSKFYLNDGVSHNENENSVVTNALKNCYDPSTWKMESYAVRTDQPANCAMRAPGNFEAVAAIEHVMDQIALELHKDHIGVRIANYRKDDTTIPTLLPVFLEKAEYHERQKQIECFNKENRWKKRAIHFVNMTYFANYLGNFSAVVSVYHGDGTVVVNGGGVEIGQGINTRLAQVTAKEFKIPVDKVTILSVNNYSNPNNFATQSSVTTECVVYAVIKSCEQIQERLAPVRASMPNATWEEIVFAADRLGILLQANYQTGDKDPSLVTNYPVYGLTTVEVEIDVLTGRHWIVRADIFEDVGKSINPALDVGQVEGAFVQALGCWTTEKIIYDKHSGELITDRTWNYHIFGAKDIPNDFRVYLRRRAYNPVGVLGSKAVGEPPMCMGFAVTGALRDAIIASRLDSGYDNSYVQIEYPVTNEVIADAAEVKMQELILN